MSQFNADGNKGYVATSAVGDGYAVKISTGTNVVVATAATDKIIGVTVGAIAAGETGTIRLRSAPGTMKVKAGGNIAIGDRVTATTDGRLITTTTAANEVVGIAMEAGAANDLIEVMPANHLYAIS